MNARPAVLAVLLAVAALAAACAGSDGPALQVQPGPAAPAPAAPPPAPGAFSARPWPVPRGPVTAPSHYTYSYYGPNPCDPSAYPYGPYGGGGQPYVRGGPAEGRPRATPHVPFA